MDVDVCSHIRAFRYIHELVSRKKIKIIITSTIIDFILVFIMSSLKLHETYLKIMESIGQTYVSVDLS